MKTLFTLLFAALAFAATAQPQKIHYQGVAVGANGKPLKNSTVGLRLSVLDSLPTGTTLYTETQMASTDDGGLFSIYLGAGMATTGIFANLPWANGNDKFLKAEMDAQGGSNYQPMGTTQLVSVPYAMAAGTANVIEEGTLLRMKNGHIYRLDYPLNGQGPVWNAIGGVTQATISQDTIYTCSDSIWIFGNRVKSNEYSLWQLSYPVSLVGNVNMSEVDSMQVFRHWSDTLVFNYFILPYGNYAVSVVPSDKVTVIFLPNTSSSAGPDQLNLAGTTATLVANAPAAGETGAWSILAGSGGNLTNANSPNATFTGVAGTIYTLRFTVSNACGSTFDEMNVSFTSGGGSGCSPQPSVANAGPDAFNQCGTTTLNATNPSVGTGTWSIISGNGGSFSNPASPTAMFTGTAGETYTLRWTVSNGCGSTADEVTVSFVSPPTTANAGLDQLNVTTPTAVLNATTPTQGSGIWTVVAGVGGSLSGASSPNATFTGTPGQSYTLRWTVTNACGSSSSDEMTVVFGATGGTPCTPLPTTANAGPDSGAFCPGSLLYANSAYVGTGQWTVLSGSSYYFSDIATHNSAFYGSSGQTYTLRWTITTACGLSFDDIVLTVPGTVNTANADPLQANIITIDTTYLLKANAANAGSVGTWSVIGGVAGTFTNINSPTATYRGFNNTFSTLKWTISNGCGVQSSDTVRLEFRLSTACNGVSSITDSRDGQVYPIVGIGTQCWMAKNLNVGTMIPTDNGDQTHNQVIEKYCYYDDLTYCTTYGGLYQWAEAVQYQNGASNLTSPNPALSGNVRGICPTGWHLPSDAEWTALENALGGSSVAGTALKSTIGWNNNGNGNNSSGFNALPGGYRNTNGIFSSLSIITYFWSSSEYFYLNAYYRNLQYSISNIYRSYGNNKYYGFSARCTQD